MCKTNPFYLSTVSRKAKVTRNTPDTNRQLHHSIYNPPTHMHVAYTHTNTARHTNSLSYNLFSCKKILDKPPPYFKGKSNWIPPPFETSPMGNPKHWHTHTNTNDTIRTCTNDYKNTPHKRHQHIIISYHIYNPTNTHTCSIHTHINTIYHKKSLSHHFKKKYSSIRDTVISLIRHCHISTQFSKIHCKS